MAAYNTGDMIRGGLGASFAGLCVMRIGNRREAIGNSKMRVHDSKGAGGILSKCAVR